MDLSQSISPSELELIMNCAKNIRKHLEKANSSKTSINIADQLNYVNQLINNKSFRKVA